ncbi:DnaB-like helicase N-terminal domain-containing protein, partial [Bacillus safensis]
MLQDKQTIMQVLGCILKDPSIVAESSKYKLVPEDFPEKFHRIIFSVMRNLQRQGVEDLNLIEIVGYLQEYPTQYKVFEDANGDEYIEKVQEFPSLENFDYYYEKLKK